MECESRDIWMCLHCGSCLCSRYQNGHSNSHYVTTGHSIVVSLGDLSVWCYECGKYVKKSQLSPLLNAIYGIKSGEKSGVMEKVEQIKTGICYSPGTEAHLPLKTLRVHPACIIETPERTTQSLKILAEMNVLSRLCGPSPLILL